VSGWVGGWVGKRLSERVSGWVCVRGEGRARWISEACYRARWISEACSPGAYTVGRMRRPRQRLRKFHPKDIAVRLQGVSPIPVVITHAHARERARTLFCDCFGPRMRSNECMERDGGREEGKDKHREGGSEGNKEGDRVVV